MKFQDRSSTDRRKGPQSVNHHNDLSRKLHYIQGRFQAITLFERRIAHEREEIRKTLEEVIAQVSGKVA